MRAITSRSQLEEFGRQRLSSNFFMRDFLYSEIAASEGMMNAPDDPDLALAAGRKLCVELLEPLNAQFGRVAVRSAYRSCLVNQRGTELAKGNCASNASNYAAHIWDRRDADGAMGATACIVLPWLVDHCAAGGDWRAMAWWIHDKLPYASMQFFPHLIAFNIQWHERPERSIYSYIAPNTGYLTRLGMDNHAGVHADQYREFPQ
ncbi:MAG: hypothetical protein Q8O54_00095 [Brevundimonas sp.]|nr:hypothetical protein [Brevundimonas sp.]